MNGIKGCNHPPTASCEHCFQESRLRMTSKDQLAEIEKHFKNMNNFGWPEDVWWLIARVKKLTEALEWYAQGGSMTLPTIKIKNMDEISELPVMVMQQATDVARKALDEE